MMVKQRIAAVGATVALSSALALGATGTASASTASAAPREATQQTTQQTTEQATVELAAVRTPLAPASCRRVWHPGAWYWFDRGGWDRFHHWQHHRERKQRPGHWGCR